MRKFVQNGMIVRSIITSRIRGETRAMWYATGTAMARVRAVHTTLIQIVRQIIDG